MIVYLDDGTDQWDSDALALHAVRVEEMNWNGFAVPVVSAAEFRRFIGARAHNDPNGTWDPDGVVDGDGALIYRDEANEDGDTWSVVGVHRGEPVYAVDGWMWWTV